MSLMELFNKRRSVRRYAPKPISKEDILKCLEAARIAPSACNSQPWHFIVIDDPVVKARVSERIFSGIYSMNKFAAQAPVLVAVVSEKMKFLAAVGAKVRDTRYYLVDIGIACEHLVLQAAELGIGSCWMGWFDEKALKQELDLPSNKKVDIVIALGYPAEDKPHFPLEEIKTNGASPGNLPGKENGSQGKIVPKTRKTLEEISSFNTY